MAFVCGVLAACILAWFLMLLRPAGKQECSTASPPPPPAEERDVLVGTLRRQEQLEVCLRCGFYHIPCQQLEDSEQPIRYIAIYQSVNLFGSEAGVRYYGRVIRRQVLPRSQITQIPSEDDSLYFVFHVAQWHSLPQPVLPKETAYVCRRTTLFLLTHSAELPQLWVQDREEFAVYEMLRKAAAGEAGVQLLPWGDHIVCLRRRKLLLLREEKTVARIQLADFAETPGSVLSILRRHIAASHRQTASETML